MNNHFAQYEFEYAIYSTLTFGMEIEIAKQIGKSPGMVSMYFNPSDDRQSPIYKAAEMLAVMIELDEESGRKALELFTFFVQKALPGNASLCVTKHRERSYNERNDFHIAEASNKPLCDRIRELSESLEAYKGLLDALRAEEKREIQQEVFKGLEVDTKIRSIVNQKIKMNGHK